jgi:hypothetical protein
MKAKILVCEVTGTAAPRPASGDSEDDCGEADPGLNPDRRGGKPANNRLSCEAAPRMKAKTTFYILLLDAT